MPDSLSTKSLEVSVRKGALHEPFGALCSHAHQSSVLLPCAGCTGDGVDVHTGARWVHAHRATPSTRIFERYVPSVLPRRTAAACNAGEHCMSAYRCSPYCLPWAEGDT